VRNCAFWGKPALSSTPKGYEDWGEPLGTDEQGIVFEEGLPPPLLEAEAMERSNDTARAA
jgi:hypothetical protein